MLIGLDTNVLARYLLQDDELQASMASDLLESFDEHTMGYVSLIVLVELYWLLKQGYKQPKTVIIDTFNALLTTNTLIIESDARIREALSIVASSSADFSDVLITLSGQARQCEYTATFDIGASKHAGMRLL